jgi:hypothetical protein
MARAGYGAALVCGGPRLLLTLSTGRKPGRLASAACRVSGAKHIVQAAVSAAIPDGEVVLAGAALDALHSAAMLGLATADKQHRRASLAEAAVAGAFAAAGIAFLLAGSRG